MAEIRVNATGGLKLYDADDSHYAQIVAGTITSNVDAITLGHDTVTIADNLSLGSDSSVLKFGADGDTTLTHTDGTGLTLNSTNKICFNDASQFIQGSSNAVLSLGATDEIDLTATAVDLNGTLNVSGVATFQSTPVFPDGSLAVADLDIDGATDIGAAIVDADLFIVDDGAGGTNRKVTASRIKTYAKTAFPGIDDTSSSNDDCVTITDNEVVINEDGDNQDFRVEADDQANFFFCDASANIAGFSLHDRPDMGFIHITTASSGVTAADTSYDELVLEGSGNCGVSILAGTSSKSGIAFGDSGDSNIGKIEYFHSGNSMQLTVSAAINQILETYTRRTLFACDSWSETTAGGLISHSENYHVVDSSNVLILNREGTDGLIQQFRHSNSAEGNVTSSGTTIQYNTFCGAHWGRLADNSQPTILRGTVMETIATMIDWYRVKYTVDKGLDTEKIGRDEIALPDGKSVGDIIKHTAKSGIEYDAEIELADNEQLPMTKISDTEDSKAVYGVFSSWDNEPDDGVNDMNVAALGAFIIRVHKDETVAIGDLLSSKGDGTAKVQADDIMRSKTIAKVTSTNKTYIYDDGSYCVPCTLHCG